MELNGSVGSPGSSESTHVGRVHFEGWIIGRQQTGYPNHFIKGVYQVVVSFFVLMAIWGRLPLWLIFIHWKPPPNKVSDTSKMNMKPEKWHRIPFFFLRCWTWRHHHFQVIHRFYICWGHENKETHRAAQLSQGDGCWDEALGRLRALAFGRLIGYCRGPCLGGRGVGMPKMLRVF